MIPYIDQESVLRDCTERLEKLGVPYMLTGSMAMTKYAMMRMTNDIDIVIELNLRRARTFVSGFEKDYYVAESSVTNAIERRSMFNLLHFDLLVKVDCVIRKDDVFQKQAFANRQKVEFSDFDVWIIGKEDLVLSKLNWAKESRSEKQMTDVANIIRHGVDEEYVNSWAKRLGVEDILSECRRILEDDHA